MTYPTSPLSNLRKAFSPAQIIQLTCLLLVSILTAGIMCFGYSFREIFLISTERYLIYPVMVFFGVSLVEKSTTRCWQLRLGCITAAWYLLSQLLHILLLIPNQDASYLLCQILLAFPFAALFGDGEKQYGLRMLGIAIVAASGVICMFTVLCALDLLPGYYQQYVYFRENDLRLWAFWFANTCSPFFAMGVIFSIGFAQRTGATVKRKVLLLALAALNYACLALTNSRTAIFAAGCMVAGEIFLMIWRRKNWKTFLLGLAAAVCLLAASVAAANGLYQMNCSRLMAQPDTAISEAEAFVDESAELVDTNAVMNTEAEVSLMGMNERYEGEHKTLNGRTLIWSSIFQNAVDHPVFAVVGGEEIPEAFPGFVVDHAHNAWLDVFLRMGLPGLVLVLIYTAVTVRNAVLILLTSDDRWKCTIALAVLGILTIGLLEPAAFSCFLYFFPSSFAMMLCAGYLSVWTKRQGA